MKFIRGLIKSVLTGSVLLLCALCGSLYPDVLHAQLPETITMISGNGAVGQRDPAIKFTLDGGATWQKAFIIPTHSYYSLIPGTKFLNSNATLAGTGKPSTRFRTYFVLPNTYVNPTLTVSVYADNVATVFLNGVQIGQQPFYDYMPNFQGTPLGTPSVMTSTNISLFHAGINVLDYDLYNFGGDTGIDFQSKINFTGCDNPLAGLVSWWPGDSNVNDFGAFNAGSLAGGVTFTQGKSDKAFTFDGTGRVVVPDADNLNITGPLALDAWVNFSGVSNPTPGGSGSPIVTKWGDPSTGTAGYGLFVDAGGYPSFNVSATGTDVISIKSPVPLTQGMFMHVAGVWNGTQAQLYMNGELVAFSAFSGPVHATNVPLLIGGFDNSFAGRSDSLIGQVDEIAVYNRALSADEVSARYFAAGTGKCKVLPAAQVFNNVRLLETIPTKDSELLLSSISKTPFSVTTTGDTTVVEWRFGNFAIGQNQRLTFDLNISNLIPGEDRILERTSQLIYKDSTNQEITVNLTPLSTHVLQSAFTVTLATDKSAYQADKDAVLSATVTNLSEYARTIDTTLVIEDSQGKLVQTLTALPALQFAAGETKNLDNAVFRTGSFYAGEYRAHLVLSENHKQIGESFAAFTINPTIAISPKITTDKASYNPNDSVTITSTVASASTNYTLANYTVKMSILSAVDGSRLYTETKPLTALLPGATLAMKSYWNTGTNLPGTYSARVVVEGGGVQLATAEATFTILPSAAGAAGVTGSITAALDPVYLGLDQSLAISLTNNGNEDLPVATISLNVINPDTQAIMQTYSRVVTIPRQGTYAGTVSVPTANLEERAYLAVLQLSLPGMAQAKSLAAAPLIVKIAPPPTLLLSTLANGAVTNNQILNISGSVTGVVAIKSVTVHGADVPFSADGSFSQALLLQPGIQDVTTIATDILHHTTTDNHTTTDIRTITLDQTAPTLTISSPADNSKTALSPIEVTGNVDETSVVTVKVKENIQTAAMKGTDFSITVIPEPGWNTIEITSTDLAGNPSSQKRSVLFDDQKPSLAITEPGQDIRTNQSSLTISGKASDPVTAVGVTVALEGTILTPAVIEGVFSQVVTFTDEKLYPISVTATNGVGTQTTVQRNIIFDKTPPNLTIDPVVTPTSVSSQIVTGTREEGTTVTFTCAAAIIGTMEYPTATSWRVPLAGLQLGENLLQVETKDLAENRATASATILFVPRALDVTISATPNQLWPPNKKLVPVTIAGNVSSFGADIKDVTISVADEYGRYNIQGLKFGETVLLEAWREGNDKDGRIYTITAVVTDQAGNRTTRATTVVVPHDMGK